jgi:hypothetical protein
MQRNRKAWAFVAILATPLGAAIARLHLIRPSPGTYFALGALAALCLVGIAYGFWDARRVIRSGEPIGN